MVVHSRLFQTIFAGTLISFPFFKSPIKQFSKYFFNSTLIYFYIFGLRKVNIIFNSCYNN